MNQSPRVNKLFGRKLKSVIKIVSGGFLAFCGINIYKENEKFYQDMLMPVVHWLDPETSHRLAVLTARYKLFPATKYKDPDILNTKLWGLEFSNPVGIAAGFDKNAEALEGLQRLGFGFIEIGSVTPEPQEGNPVPRVFRLTEDKAVINRYGFNSDGHEVVYSRVKQCRQNLNFKGIIGVNLGKNKMSTDASADYVKGVKKFGDIADYLVINVSSPNTPGLRSLQHKEHLQDLLEKVIAARNNLSCSKKPALLLKLSPDLSSDEMRDIANLVTNKKYAVDGLIISNTTISRPEHLKSEEKSQEGGLSGQPLKDLSTKSIKEMHRLTRGQVPIIGVGGIATGEDAMDKISAGASLVQLYSALAFSGPPVVSKIKREMEESLQKECCKNIASIVGVPRNKV